MQHIQEWISTDKVGIEKYYHPFFEQYSIYSPDRRTSIFVPSSEELLSTRYDFGSEENICAFCLGNTNMATPEKRRAIKLSNNNILYEEYPPFTEKEQKQEVLFRRQANLFEVLSYSYWQNKYGLQTSQQDIERIHQDFCIEFSRKSLEDLLQLKLAKSNQQLSDFSLEERKILCEPFYAGYHELLTSGRHYLPHATHSSQLFHSGYISWKDYRVSVEMICQILEDMRSKNPYIIFIAVFQNWLSSAGASFEHWHKQILGMDFWGRILTREANLTKNDPSFYKNFICSIVNQKNLMIAENEHALAYIETGCKTGYITICSKSKNLRPQEHTQEEIYGMSDLAHALFRTLSPLTPYNEEWFYTPFCCNQEFATPWRIMINIRTTFNAGFENITQTFISPISLTDFAVTIREKLEQNKKHIAPGIIITSKKINPNVFQYVSEN